MWIDPPETFTHVFRACASPPITVLKRSFLADVDGLVLLKGSFLNKLTDKEMMMVNGGRILKSEEWDLDTCEHIMHWSDGTTTREPMVEIQVIAKR